MANDRLIILTANGGYKSIGGTALAGQVPARQPDGSIVFVTPSGGGAETVVAKEIHILISGAALAAGAVGLGFLSRAVRINRAVLLIDAQADVAVDIVQELLSAYRSAPQSICGATPPEIVSSRKFSDSNLIGWNRFLDGNTCLELQVSGLTGAVNRLLLILDVEEAVDGFPLVGFVADPDSVEDESTVIPVPRFEYPYDFYEWPENNGQEATPPEPVVNFDVPEIAQWPENNGQEATDAYPTVNFDAPETPQIPTNNGQEEVYDLPDITETSFVSGTQYLFYSELLNVTGTSFEYTWTSSDLPTGLSLVPQDNGRSCRIEGIPTATWSSSVTVRATDHRGNYNELTATFTVASGTLAPHITQVVESSAAIGGAFAVLGYQFGSTQGSSTIKVGDVDATVVSWSETSIDATVGAGTPTGTQDIDVTVGGQTATGQIDIF